MMTGKSSGMRKIVLLKCTCDVWRRARVYWKFRLENFVLLRLGLLTVCVCAKGCVLLVASQMSVREEIAKGKREKFAMRFVAMYFF